MSCEMVAKVGKVINIESQALELANVSINDKEVVSVVTFSGLLGANCYGSIEEAVLTVIAPTTPDSSNYNVYFYSEDPSSYITVNVLDNTNIHGSLLGIVKFTSYEDLTATGKLIKYSSVIPAKIILKTALESSLIYAVVINASGGAINYTTNSNTIKLKLKLWRY